MFIFFYIYIYIQFALFMKLFYIYNPYINNLKYYIFYNLYNPYTYIYTHVYFYNLMYYIYTLYIICIDLYNPYVLYVYNYTYTLIHWCSRIRIKTDTTSDRRRDRWLAMQNWLSWTWLPNAKTSSVPISSLTKWATTTSSAFPGVSTYCPLRSSHHLQKEN